MCRFKIDVTLHPLCFKTLSSLSKSEIISLLFYVDQIDVGFKNDIGILVFWRYFKIYDMNKYCFCYHGTCEI